MTQEPSNDDLDALTKEIEQEIFTPTEADPLEDLYSEALQGRQLRKPQRRMDPSLRDALDATAKRLKEFYSNPDNWKRTRGLMIIDHATHSVIGNYSEYIHRQQPTTRKLIREHQPIAIDGQEEVDGFLGSELERKVRGIEWDSEKEIQMAVLLDEIFAEAPEVKMKVCMQVATVVRAELLNDTQFATPSGNLLLKLPAGTNIWPAVSTDTKNAVRKVIL